MERTIAKLTVFFEEPFWVGVYERETAGCYEVSKILFGAEPKDYEVYAYFLENCYTLRFSPAMDADSIVEKRMNPKRMQREVTRQLKCGGMGTKAQQALKLQQEQGKQARKVCKHEQREAEKQLRFALQQEKRREKHKGH